MSESQAIALYRPLLHTIAYRLTGCATIAEDIVQDTYLKWLVNGPEKIRNTKAYLITSVKNNCLKYSETLQVRKSEWLEQLPAGWLDRVHFQLPANVDVEEEIREAITAIHHKLEPLEKGVFILRGIFQLEYEELQEIFEKKKDHIRQLFSRARKKMQQRPVKSVANGDPGALWSKVETAFRQGSLSDLVSYLKGNE
ncbi:sigma-70 family RNA polymerase sigma factor [Fulvivirga sedimenti]|uniref:Sigma-70 family RNA polymerase sigma factor n=1 Tax=Fulvivirga sedimenti TaxID=2879465 RepID=A0A9X1HYP3_9BACT|nr:sigma-70 family RNA polymerase sigma factor [Fulvivirga sedimenti]MCA6078869.1 sigma-70 family RNA polymerase sigma factor [Fulvivirga sedimenti]